MFSFIEKSGTGIEKSGTGIEKSGTGIEKSGTGIRRVSLTALIAGALFATQAFAAEPEVMVTSGDDQVFISVHSGAGVLVGRAASLDDSGYHRIALYSAVGPNGSGAVFQPLVAGSGSGKEVAGSGSGSSKEVAGSGSGSSTEVAGSGSGSSTEVAGSGSGKEVAGSGSGAAALCPTAPGLLVAGSGSGSATDVAGSGSGSAKEVAGSGSGSSTDVAGSGSGSSTEVAGSGSGKEVAGSGSGAAGEAAGCAALQNAWGVAEVVIDDSGAHVVVHQISGSRAEEYLVAFLPGSISEVAHSLDRGSSNRGFIAVP
jgi:hypothetical protein